MVVGFLIFVRLLAGNVFFYFSKKHDPARPGVSGDRKSKENLCKIEVLDQKLMLSTVFFKFFVCDLSLLGTSAAGCGIFEFSVK